MASDLTLAGIKAMMEAATGAEAYAKVQAYQALRRNPLALARLVLRLADALGELGAAVAAEKTAYPMPSAPDPEPRLTAAECAARSLLTELGADSAGKEDHA